MFLKRKATRMTGKDEFTCPKCGGRFFGSRMSKDPSTGELRSVERFCHDEFKVGCEWHGRVESVANGPETTQAEKESSQ